MFEKPPLDDVILHYGTKRHSGRYKWGSGDDLYQHENAFLKEYDTLKSQGLSQTDIASKMGINTTQLRNNITWANSEITSHNTKQAHILKDTGMSNVSIGQKLGVSEATVLNYLSRQSDSESVKKQQLGNITDSIKKGVANTGYLDVGVGVERQLGISRTKFNTVVNKIAEEEGYHIHELYVPRLNDPTGTKNTTVKVLTKEPDIKVVRQNSHEVRPLNSWSDDGSLTLTDTYPPHMLDLKRIKIRHEEDGGDAKDGLIELRPGVKDLDLGRSKYAQVRIATEGNLYLKGMAAYADESHFPPGVDIIFNTNKSKDVPVNKVLKELKMTPDKTDDPSAMFGSAVRKQKGALNIVNEEGHWNDWSGTMSSQFLSKQPTKLIKDRLDATHEGLQKEFDEINSMTNPVVKKYLMDKYIKGLDAKAKQLKAKGLAGTKSHVLLPFPDMNPNEIFAPNFNDGDRVVLVRHPHGGIFEIPDLVVNNKHAGARKMIGTNSLDAVGIHPSVAEKLSGADFDGDTALVIPNNHGMIKTKNSLKELNGFVPGMYKVGLDSPVNVHTVDKKTGEIINTGKTITDKHKQTQMGLVSNLITDMTIKGASDSELARAVKHSMVIIDSEKHNLDWKQSAIDNSISALRKKYQKHTNPDTGKATIGASTLVSRSKRKVDISDETKVLNSVTNSIHSTGYLDVSSGAEKLLNVNKDTFSATVKKMTKDEGYHIHTHTDAQGNKKKVLTKEEDPSVVSANLDKVTHIKPWTFNPDKYSSGYAQDQLYSDYVKSVMSVKNNAMKTSMKIKPPAYSKEAAKMYAPELKSMNDKLNTALLNAPKERQAQILTNKLYYDNIQKGMSKDEIKKLKVRSLAKARVAVGAKKSEIELSAMEWESIQAGAVSNQKLLSILENSNMDIIRKHATPHELKLNTAKATRARTYLDKGYTYAEIANILGVSTTTLREELK
jgi:predicted transcriptional regulator